MIALSVAKKQNDYMRVIAKIAAMKIKNS